MCSTSSPANAQSSVPSAHLLMEAQRAQPIVQSPVVQSQGQSTGPTTNGPDQSARGPLHIDTGLPASENHQIPLSNTAAIDPTTDATSARLSMKEDQRSSVSRMSSLVGESVSAGISPAGQGALVLSPAEAPGGPSGPNPTTGSRSAMGTLTSSTSHMGSGKRTSFATDQIAGSAPPLPLICALCMQPFYGSPNNPRSVPRLLPCLHSYCTGCLLDRCPGHAIAISCPRCSVQCILPPAPLPSNAGPVASGVLTLPVNVLANRVKTSRPEPDGHRNGAADVHVTWPESSPISPRGGGGSALKCLVHRGKTLTQYCRTCEKLACDLCAASPECSVHHVETLSVAARQHRLLALDMLKRTETALPGVVLTRGRLQGMLGAIAAHRSNVSADIDRAVDSLRDALEARRRTLKELLDNEYAEKVCAPMIVHLL